MPARDSNIGVHFVLLDKPNLHPDVLPFVRPEKGLKEAEDALKTSITSGKFKVHYGMFFLMLPVAE